MRQPALPVNGIIYKIANMKLLDALDKYTKTPIEDLILRIYQERYQDKDARETLNIIRRDELYRTKRRWYNSALKDYLEFNEKKRKKHKELAGEYHLLLEYYQNYGAGFFEKFVGKAGSIQGVIEERRVVLEEWSKDTNSCLTDYPYLQQKTNKQIEKAIHIDLAVLIGLELTSSHQISEGIIESPYSTLETPLFSNSRAKISLDESTLTQGEKEYYSNKYNVENGSSFELLIDKEYAVRQGFKVPDLDLLDYKIFLEVMNHRNELFATQKLIIVKIGDIVKALYNNDGKKNYQIVEERLEKMKYFSMTKRDKDGSWSAIGIFSDVKVTSVENGSNIAEIFVTEAIYKDYIENQTVRIYKDKVHNLTSGSALHLIFPLQKERLICYQTGSSYEVSRDYLFFRSKLRFRKSRKLDNLKEIEKALEELIQQRIVVKSYKRTGEIFHITFFPIQEREVQDLLEGSYDYTPLADQTQLLL